MSFRPPPASRLPPERSRSPISDLPSSLSQTLVLLVLVGFAHIASAEPSLDPIAPSATRLLLAQANPNAAAVSSQAVATQPEAPKRVGESTPPQPAIVPAQPTPPAPESIQVMDPRLDLTRPRNSQLSITQEQTVLCGEISVLLPATTYKQKLIVENPQGRRAIGTTSLRPQQVGLGYIRYESESPLQVNGVTRSGGLDVPIRKEDSLPVRIWYKKMVEPDTVTKVFSFILPPVALVAGGGAWASGNVLLPDSPPEFTEARDYFLKEDVALPVNATNTPTLTPLSPQRKFSGQRTP